VSLVLLRLFEILAIGKIPWARRDEGKEERKKEKGGIQ